MKFRVFCGSERQVTLLSLHETRALFQVITVIFGLKLPKIVTFFFVENFQYLEIDKLLKKYLDSLIRRPTAFAKIYRFDLNESNQVRSMIIL